MIQVEIISNENDQHCNCQLVYLHTNSFDFSSVDALELHHPTSRSRAPRQNYSTLSQVDNLSDYSGPPTHRYYTVGGHGSRRKSPASVIGAPRYV